MVRYSYNRDEVTKEVIQGLLGKYAYIAKAADEKLAYKQKTQYDFAFFSHSDGTIRIAINTIYCFNDENDNRVNLSISIVIGKTKHATAEKRYFIGKRPSETIGVDTVYKDWIVPSEKKIADIFFYTFGA